MADVINPASPHIDRPFQWQTWEVTPGTLTGVTDVTVVTLPAGTLVTGAKLVTTAADVGATTSTADIEIGATGAGDTTVLTGGSDIGGVIGGTNVTYTAANLSTINAVSLGGSALVVNLEVTYAGTATTAPTFAVMLKVGRLSY